jgi:preprotein translocase subunit YajC
MSKRLILLLALFAAIQVTVYAQNGSPAGGGYGSGQGGGMMGGGRGVGGTVTAVSGSTITIKTEEGDTYQILTSANSRIVKRVDRQPEAVKISDIHVGDALMAGGEVDAKAKTVGAVFVMLLTPEQAAQAKKRREEFGKTWTAGEVTVIKDTDITIKRMDGVAQTVSVDENTSFKKRGDSITLADIQVGDRVTAQGALKGTTFVATAVNIGRAGGPGGPGGPGAGGPPPAAGTPPPAAGGKPPSQ